MAIGVFTIEDLEIEGRTIKECSVLGIKGLSSVIQAMKMYAVI
jgi:hypothetical protein